MESVKAAKAASLLLAAMFLPLFTPVSAQEYPSRPIRLVIPWPPGGITDVISRTVGAALSESLGQQVVPDNRPGAAGTLGVSIGAHANLDLALHHPSVFRAVISLEGALHVGGRPESLLGFWHPQVSNESKARMMQGLTSPTSPEALRKETIQTYAAGWPPAFLGDLHYYMVDYDLRERASEIDTSQVGVHILSGEYDYSASPAMGRAAHEAIAGSTFGEMKGVGHFPMSENPDAFLAHLLPVLDSIVAGR